MACAATDLMTAGKIVMRSVTAKTRVLVRFSEANIDTLHREDINVKTAIHFLCEFTAIPGRPQV